MSITVLCWGPCDEAPGICAKLLIFSSVILIAVTLPFSLCLVIKVVQEYEKTVIFRLGRILRGGARGPGVFFIIPCVDLYEAGRTMKYRKVWGGFLEKITQNFGGKNMYTILGQICSFLVLAYRVEDTSDMIRGHRHENTEFLCTATRGNLIHNHYFT